MLEIISYTDSLSTSWMLQKTSGVFKQPVTFVGLNNKKIKSMEYYPKIQAYVDALKNSKATHVFIVDAFDTILLKTPSVPVYLKDKVVVSSGCSSWPKCYDKLLYKTPDFVQCMYKKLPQCHPNSGNIYGPREQLLSLFQNMSVKREEMNEYIQKVSDQASLMHVIHVVPDIVIDYNSTVFVNLYACHGKTPRQFIGRTTCFQYPWDPMSRVSVRDGSVFYKHSHDISMPSFAHASGRGYDKLRSILSQMKIV